MPDTIEIWRDFEDTPWILSQGVWNDNGVWDDSDRWRDDASDAVRDGWTQL